MEVDRKTFLTICHMSESLSRELRKKPAARLPYISARLVLALMPKKGKARLVCSFSGGDEEITLTKWSFAVRDDLRHLGTSNGVVASGVAIMTHTRLWELENRLEAAATQIQASRPLEGHTARSQGGSL